MKRSEDFTKSVYTFNDIPKKRKYIFDRVKKIYVDVDDSIINKIIDDIKIIFREQEEKGASNHLNRTIYVSSNELEKYDMNDKNDFLKYLEHPMSIITHETTHIFQNIFKAFPDVKYLKKEKDGKWVIDYKRYVTDKGEVQSRLEQIVELLNWGFAEDEIVELLYNRRYKDRSLWRDLVEQAKEIKKLGSSKLPGDEDENIANEQDRYKNEYQQKNLGKNYERDYLSSGHERE